jgi:hypothetical protein
VSAWTRAVVGRPAVGLTLAAVLATATYLGASRAGGFLGFPLDDAWIHQTYARNLGLAGEFAFVPGHPSAGSTSPAWTALLAIGYALRLDFRVWTYALGAALLALNAWLAHRLALKLLPQAQMAASLAGLLVALEWHLVWAAGSGMETLLFSALALLVFLLPADRYGFWLGLCAGASVLARPDGLLLLPFALVRALAAPGERARGALQVAAGFAVVCLPYLAFNQWLAGTVWPNTFYAKQAEYAALRGLPLWRRLAQVAVLPFVGAQALLVPGLIVMGWDGLQRRAWDSVLPLGWVAAMIGAYALRLPVTYQHGRYLIPVIPVIVVLGTIGLARSLHWQSTRMLVRVGSRAWVVAAALVGLAFVALGAQAYTREVQIIESEMVASARWIEANTDPGALVAAHDIGALGYYGHRQLLDLAGLATPEVIPFIRDEGRLQIWLDQSGADYLMTFPGWYPVLVQRAKGGLRYQTGSPYSPAAGGENMAIYAWKAVLP